ncbi:MAG TPA: hypothetical protein VFT82_01935, partial [Candidatus Paceibacterota bacterium]|nr:hypothetical protein [Candidatus Paceibacterota bacterium]
PVPAALKEAHLALINSLEAIIEGLQGMMTIKTDPVGATKLISRYEDGIQSISLPIEIIRNYLKRQSVAFSSYDSGYILTQ